MPATFRKIKIAVRLMSSMAILLGLMITMIVVGLSAISNQRRATADVQDYRTATSLAMQVKFRSADFNGWQTAYAFDVTRGVPDAAADSAESRAAFLAAAEAFRTELNALSQARLTAQDRATVSSATAMFDEFMTMDAKIIANFRTGDPVLVTAAERLVAVDEIAIFTKLAAAVDDLVASIDDRSAAAVAAATAASRTSSALMLAAGAGAVTAGAALGLLLTRSITRPLRALNRRLRDIADGEGDLTQRVHDDSRDEIGQAARSFNRFAERMQVLVGRVAAEAARVARAADELGTISTQLADGAAGTSSQAGVVSSGAEEVSAIVSTMAASAEQMSASIAEISRSASRASEIVEDGVRATADANETVARLGVASAEIQSVVDLITAIAQQTNLLALNATIEAARAGETGKGFAVVAGEVKNLAEQTATATETIVRQIAAIRGGSEAAVEAIARIGTVVSEINSTQLAIASAIEEQTATTAEMSRNVAETATGAGEIAGSIQDVAQTAERTSTGASRTQDTAQDLGHASHDLQSLVATFRY
ncbi:methyl-accepting chemotaxis protein [Actinoplanes solisilvae]|uniref:methyl-accepting chemotaxis protein n=1 Tax=Actinoplanes solisilvae TaxID=2486853 RepID=UPI000FD8470F|nr:methyl-accepting chemotaxis protein [Actinoplanes solisilvae]